MATATKVPETKVTFETLETRTAQLSERIEQGWDIRMYDLKRMAIDKGLDVAEDAAKAIKRDVNARFSRVRADQENGRYLIVLQRDSKPGAPEPLFDNYIVARKLSEYLRVMSDCL